VKKYFITITLLIFPFLIPVSAQKIDINSAVSVAGFYSGEDTLPFWIFSNQNGAFSSKTELFASLQSNLIYSLNETSQLEVKASIFVRDGVEDEFQRDELFVKYTNKWLGLTLGSEHSEVRFNGLSTVNDNFLLSGNSRAFPGLIAEANKPFKLSNKFEIDWAIAHYELNDDRFVDNTLLHYKRLHFIWNINLKNKLQIGVEHYAQWGGTSPELGKQPSSFGDFIDVFFAKKASDGASSGDTINALGNHLGIINFEYTLTPSSGKFVFYYQHPFEDGSGTRFANVPDGIWGFYFEPNTTDFTTFVKGVLLEYVDTSDQSGRRNDSRGRDNYFNSGVYRSGWTYENNIIGLPFITQDPSGLRISNNRVKAIHIGVAASQKKWSFLAKTSFVQNLGTFGNPISPVQKIVYSYLQSNYTHEKYGKFTLHLGVDFGKQIRSNYGAGLQYTYSF